MVRNLGMTADLEDLARTVIKTVDDRPVLIGDVARVVHDVQPMRGDASVNGTPGVILSIDKAPGFDTLALTATIEKALADLAPALPAGVETVLLFRQGDFIQHAIANLKEAIRDGAIMVSVVLFVFLLSFRTTAITLAAIPLSFAITILVFKWIGVSVNSMTLGGLAVALGMVVDDAIVDVENVFRRLRENASLPVPKPRREVIASASAEVRNSILYATLIIVLVFLPLLALEGIEGRLFTPIAIATITSMAASFVVSLTVIPVLCSLWLKPKAGAAHTDSWLVRALKSVVRHTALRAALAQPLLVLALVGIALAASFSLYPQIGKEFLPAFNEGSATISLASAPGTSLRQSNEGRRGGRAPAPANPGGEKRRSTRRPGGAG
jgi:Cu/Ag efflux pump CusA